MENAMTLQKDFSAKRWAERIIRMGEEERKKALTTQKGDYEA